MIAGKFKALLIILMAPLSSAISNNPTISEIWSEKPSPLWSYLLASHDIEKVIKDVDNFLNINNLTVTVPIVCKQLFLNKTCDKEQIYKSKGTSLKHPFQDRGVLCQRTDKQWEFIPSDESRTCDFNCDCEDCWDEAFCQWMENTNTTREQLVEKGGALTGEGGVLCKQSRTQRWEHMVKGGGKMCNGKADCLNGLDEENCAMYHIVALNWNHWKERRHVNLTHAEFHGQGAFREDGVVCEDNSEIPLISRAKWVFLGFSEPERCDGYFVCNNGLDEANCTDLLGSIPVFIALGILVVCLLAHMLREAHYHYMGGSSEVFAKQFSHKMRNPFDKAVDTIIEAAQIKGRARDGGTESNVPYDDDDDRIDNDCLEAAFSQVHAAEAGTKVLIGAGFTFLLCPRARHWLATFIMVQEQRIHENNQQEMLRCLRKKTASNSATTEFLDSVQHPGSLAKANLKAKATMVVIVDALLEQTREETISFCGMMLKSAKSTLFRGFWPLLKTTAYLMDYIKDGCLFAYLLQRFKLVLSSFLRGLIVFHGVSVISSGIIVGLAIQDSKTIVNLDGIQSVYIVWLLRFFFFICTPLMPLAIIFKAISLTGEKKRLEATWRRVKDTSVSMIWQSYDTINSQKRKVMSLFSYMKTIEANTEASPQLFSWVVFIVASVMMPSESGLTFALDDSIFTWPFLVLSLFQSYSSIIVSVLSAVNIEKNGGLSMTNKIFLGLSISLQLLARLLLMVPIAILALQTGFGWEWADKDYTETESTIWADIRKKRSTGTWDGYEWNGRMGSDGLPLWMTRGPPLSPTAASLLLILPLVIHWLFLILLWARLNIVTFWNLSLKDKLLHLLSNTMVTLPVRKTREGAQVHKARETFWSLVLVGINLLATSLITSALINENIFPWSDSKVSEDELETNWLTRLFLDESVEMYVYTHRYTFAGKRYTFPSDKYKKPRFLFAFGLPSLLSHLAGSLLLLLQYKLVHPWRHLGREREANFVGKLGGTKRGLDEEMSHWRSSDAVSFYEQP